MNKNLYFLPLIADALMQPDLKVALRTAFKRIKELGRLPEYKQGFIQFQHFMVEVKKNWGNHSTSDNSDNIELRIVQDLALQLGTGLWEGDTSEIQAALKLIKAYPRLWEEFNKLCQETSEPETTHRNIEIVIDRDGEPFGSIIFDVPPCIKKIKTVKPGFHTFQLTTGRIIWQGELTEKEIFWGKAFPEQALALAADTGDKTIIMTREIKLMGGELIIRVIPEIENGCIEICLKGNDFEG